MLSSASPARPLAGHRSLWIALALAALVRLLVVIAFPPAFVFSDGPTYLGLVRHLTPLTERASGYGVFLNLLARVSDTVWLAAVVQHGLGLATGVVVYAALRRWGVSDRVALLASLPVLFDAMELVVEHSILSDVLFDLLVVAGVTVLGWHRQPRLPHVAVGGLLLGLAVCVRVVGQPLVLSAVLFCLIAATGLRRKVVVTAVVLAGFAAPVVGYMAWYDHHHAELALTDSSGRALYMRTTTFVECDRITVPAYQRDLCPDEPVGHRQDPTFYGWHDPDGNHGLNPPDGLTSDQAMRQFAITAIKAQPLDFAWVSARDFAYNFFPIRIDLFDYDTADKWSFDRYTTLKPTGWTRPAYLRHGGELPSVRQPYANLLVVYGRVVYLWGPLLLGTLVLAVAGLVVRRPPTAPRTRALVVLTGSIGVGLMAAPDLTAEFVWRYQLPAIVLLPMAAALAWTRLTRTRAPEAQELSPEPPPLPAPTGRTAG